MLSTREANSIFTKFKFMQPISKAFNISALILVQNQIPFLSLGIYIKHLFIYGILSDTRERKAHLKTFRGTRRALGYSEGTGALKAISHLGTWALRYLGTRYTLVSRLYSLTLLCSIVGGSHFAVFESHPEAFKYHKRVT